MGNKGDKFRAETAVIAADILEKLISIDGLTSKKMFGGQGFMYNSKMFGFLTAKSQCYFKVNETNLDDYTKLGSEKHSRMPYYHIPNDILENKDLLIEFALKSIAVAESKKK